MLPHEILLHILVITTFYTFFQKTARKSADLVTETTTTAGKRVDGRRPRWTT